MKIQRDDSIEEILGHVGDGDSVWLFRKKENIFKRLYNKLFGKRTYKVGKHNEINKNARPNWRDDPNVLYHRRHW